MLKTHYFCAELAAMKLHELPASVMGWSKLVKREGWPSVEVACAGGKGGLRREYAPPARILKLIESERAMIAGAKFAEAMIAARRALHEEMETAQVERLKKGVANLNAISGGGLRDHEQRSLSAHCELADGWKVWFVKISKSAAARGMKKPGKKASFAAFAQEYAAGHVPISEAVRKTYPMFSARSIERWVTDYESGEFGALVDKRNGDKSRDHNIFTQQAALLGAVQSILIERPGIKTAQLTHLLETAAIDSETGEVLFTAPTYHQTYRFQRAWIEKNPELYLAATNPDAWKNHKMLALGSASADVLALNQRWEMDATPADWMLTDADGVRRRYTVSVCIDVWSRRMMVVMAPTPKAQTHAFCLRQAMLAWGVPREIVTDNGKDYQAEEFKRVLQALGIDHHTTGKFSPWEKPHIERGIGTLNHSILEMLPNFVGHSVAERSAIEARKSFAERLFTKNDVVEIDMSAEDLHARINAWLAGSYEHNKHGGLDMSPTERVATWTGTVHRIDDERALDILLLRPAGNSGRRTLQKKGIQIDGAWFIAAEFGKVDVGNELDVFQTADMGEVVCYHEGTFICLAQCPERRNIDQQAIAAIAKGIQAKRVQDAKRELKRATKGVPKVDELLDEHLRRRAAAARALPAPAENVIPYTTPALDEAKRAVAAKDGVTARIPSARPARAPRRSDRLPAENHADWQVVGGRIAAGEDVSKEDRSFHESWPNSAQGRSVLGTQKKTASYGQV